MTAPSILILILLLYLLFKPAKYLIIAAFALSAFGSLAVIPPAVVGNVTLLPSPMALLFLIGKVIVDAKSGTAFFHNAFNFKYMGLLTAFTIVGVVGAILLPKFLIGQVYTFPMRSEAAVIRVPLAPTSANITQSAYLTISCLTAITLAVMVKTKGFVGAFRESIIWLAALMIITGIMDYVFGVAGIGAVLDVFRTASYSVILDAEVSGVRRIIGLTPEASNYGSLTVTALALLIFCRNLYTPSFRNKVVFPLAFVCAVMAALCTSSTAYVAMAIIVAVYFWDASGRLGLGTREEKIQTMREFVGMAAFSLIGLVLIVSLDETREVAFKMIDNMVLKKSASDSFIERSSWNAQGMKVFMETHGLGIGLGSARTSNFFVNILASTGALGGFFFFSFLLKVFLIRCQTQDVDLKEMVRGSKLTLLPTLAGMFLTGTTPDYGGIVAIFFGIIIGAATAVKVRSAPPFRRPRPENTLVDQTV